MQELFSEVSSSDILEFEFGPSKYRDQLDAAILKTSQFCAVTVTLRDLTPTLRVVWVAHNFAFMGGSLGCAEGEKVTRAFEYALEHELPVIVQCKTGGARMQEGTLSLMQMAKVSVAVQALRKNPKCPFISLLEDPTYGGVSASYAMQADVKIGVRSTARIGFAGPSVILNTMFEMDQAQYDLHMPPDFQSASYVQERGQIDMVIDEEEGVEDFDAFVASKVASVCAVLTGSYTDAASNLSTGQEEKQDQQEGEEGAEWEYANARHIERCQV
jgi:acetyl-CoA carboxylase carboxyl transferase beta subunit